MRRPPSTVRRDRGGPAIPAALLVALAAAACGGSAPAGPDPVATPDGLRVSVLQYRSDYTIGLIEIKVTNTGATPFTVTAARLASPVLRGDAAWLGSGPADDVVIAPGTSTDLPAPLPPMRCPTDRTEAPAGSADLAATGTATLDLRTPGGGTARTRPVPVVDEFGTIAAVRARDCRRRTALAIADIEVGPLRVDTVAGRLRGRLDLRFAPSGRSGRLTVTSVAGTTLLRPPAGATAWTLDTTVGAGTGSRRVSLEIEPARCDPHAIAEDKLGTVLPVTLRVDGGEPGIVDAPADPVLRTRIQDFVRQACTAG